MKKAYVIGAGPLGLSASYELIKRGYKVIIIDSDSAIGGLTRPFKFKNDLVEYYYHFFYWNDHHSATNFLKNFKKKVNIAWNDISTKSYINGNFVDFDLPLSIIKLAGFDFLKLIFILIKIKLFRIDKKLDKIPAEDWALEKFGKNFYIGVWRPLLKNKFGIYSSKISAYWLITRIKRHMSTKVGSGGRCRFGYLVGTYQPFLNLFKKTLYDSGGEIFTSTKIQRVVVKNNSITKLVSKNCTIHIDKDSPIFSCIPLGNLKTISNIDNHIPYLKHFKLVGAVVLILMINKQLSDSYWTTVSDQKIPFDVIIQQNRLYPNSKSEIVYLSRYYNQSNLVFKRSDDYLIDIFLKGLFKMFPYLNHNNIVDTKLIRTKSAAPVPSIGMLDNIPPFRSPLKNLYHGGFEHIYPEDRGVGNSISVGKSMIESYFDEEC